MMVSAATIVSVVCCVVFGMLPKVKSQEAAAKAFLDKYNKEAPVAVYPTSQASWAHNTNLTDYNKKISLDETLKWSSYAKEIRLNASKINLNGVSADRKRQLTMIKQTASSTDNTVVEEMQNILLKMEEIYSKGAINDSKHQAKSINVTDGMLRLDPHLYNIISKSTDEKELLFAWKGWRDAVGPEIRPHYKKFVALANRGAIEHKWKDFGQWKRSAYEVDDLQKLAEGLWNDIKPFYIELHAYVRYRLTKKYSELVKEDKPIPAHLLGNMWAQSWGNIYQHVIPFPAEPNLDITDRLKSKLKNAEGMFKEAENFFVSIGWPKLPASFWKKSMLTKPAGRDVVCHASAWDFYSNYDVRVKMCTQMNQDDFTTVHHELGHIYYYLLYWNQTFEYRTGANPGFHEAVGDVMALSVQTPRHLHAIGLLDSVPTNTEGDLNFLMQMALEKVAFIPFGYMIDQWRWKVFSGEVSDADYNAKWWEMRTKYQGISSPVPRSENDFDPGAKFHVPADTPYIRYFFSHILQFNFHQEACLAAGHTGPLHNCSIYNSKVAGKKLGDMLKLGKSVPWPVAYETLTGKKDMDAKAVENYFRPLYVWMQKQRKQHGYSYGWDEGNSASLVYAGIISMVMPLVAVILNN